MKLAGAMSGWCCLSSAAAGMVALVVASAAAAGAPVTGRAQDMRFSFDELMHETASEYQAYFERLEARRGIERDTAKARRVERIFRQVLPQALRLHRPSEALRWGVFVLSQGAANFALPDGRIFVAAGWARRGRLGDDELALLIAHEIAHVICDHMLERVSALAAKQPRGAHIRDLLRQSREQWQVLAEIAPLMRTQEIEADRVGAAIIGASGVPLASAVGLFEHMARAEARSIGMAFVNSHDTALRRKADLLAWAFSMDWRAGRSLRRE
ncbi:MAG TPA: M48 family metalloprotease [Burkholderiales bacterium]|nr:M48 family metalloprotease [Burkholderiales bacterium]